MLSLMTAASAADLAARPYTKAPPLSPAYNWSGFYIGAMGGYAFDSGNGGGFGGGTIGYNWQAPGSQFVFGIEIDAAGASIKDSQTGVIFGVLTTVESKVNALGSVTGRVGVAADAVLFYAKGGYAWANNELSASGIVNGSDSHVHSGYTVGGGIEYCSRRTGPPRPNTCSRTLEARIITWLGSASIPVLPNSAPSRFGINYHFK
jgi:outer membrane immunogenic protein